MINLYPRINKVEEEIMVIIADFQDIINKDPLEWIIIMIICIRIRVVAMVITCPIISIMRIIMVVVIIITLIHNLAKMKEAKTHITEIIIKIVNLINFPFLLTHNNTIIKINQLLSLISNHSHHQTQIMILHLCLILNLNLILAILIIR